MTSSPLYPQSNGFIERSVQTVKNLLRNAEASGQDPYLARNRQDMQSKLTRELRKLNQGEQANMFQHRTYTWIPVEVKEETGELRSYIIKTTDGSEIRRNRVQLKPINKIPPPSKEQVASNHDSLLTDEDMPKPSASQFSSPELPKVPVQSPVPSCQNDTNLPMTTRSGRIVKMPSRLDMFCYVVVCRVLNLTNKS